ncbi:MAG: 50S ribosomal protein L30 [Actinobacteria bacterium]|nr:50S ribosomal protein L30 [Actinomycetota bacterium]
MAKQWRIRQVRSIAGTQRFQRATIRALGLGRIGATSMRPDNAAVRGMIATIAHLVDAESVTD